MLKNPKITTYILKCSLILIISGTVLNHFLFEHSYLISIVGLASVLCFYFIRYKQKLEHSKSNISKLVLIVSFSIYGILYFASLLPSNIYGAILIFPILFFVSSNKVEDIRDHYFNNTSEALQVLLIFSVALLLVGRYLRKLNLWDSPFISIIALVLFATWILFGNIFTDIKKGKEK